METLSKILLTFLLISFSLFSHAEGIRYYDVEVVLFENLDNASRQGENWPNSVELELPETTIEIGQPYPGPIPKEYDPKLTFKALTQKDYQLQEQAKKIDESDSRRVLLHAGWRQPGMAREEALSVYFKRQIPGTSPGSSVATEVSVDPMATSRLAQAEAGELEGMIKVILSRYLHVDTDIVFRPQIVEEPQSFFAMEVMENTVQPVVYRLHQTRRRMRSRELHYLDNPVLGMLVLITPYEVTN
jgi:hypothetical protein